MDWPCQFGHFVQLLAYFDATVKLSQRLLSTAVVRTVEKVRRPAEGRSKNNNAVFVAFQSCLRSGHFRKSCLTANHPGIRVQRRKLLRSLVAVFWQRPCTAADACSLTDPEWHRPIQAPGGQHNATHASPICRRPPADRPRKTCCRNGTQQLAAVGTMVQP
jgi:hypothetical protein